MGHVFRVFFMVTALFLSACASGSGRPETLPVPDATSSLRTGDLRIAPLDLLDIKVFGVPDLSGPVQVDPAGDVKIPLVGLLPAKGYTTFEFSRLLELRLGQTYLQNPQVTVRITESFGQQVTVEGAVEKPGIYPIKGQMTLLQAIAVSGGPKETANRKKVVIFRTVEGKKQAAGFDLTKIRSGRMEDPQVFGNDIIVVEGSGALSGYREIVRTIPTLGVFAAIF